MTQKYKIVNYIDNGKDIFDDWLKSLKDKKAQAAIYRVIDRLQRGNLGNNHYCRDGVWEIIIDYGPGYRVYYSIVGNVLILLLCAGTKRTQNKDISRAVKYLQEFKESNNND